MKLKLILCTGLLSLITLITSCDNSRTNTKREMDETSTEMGDSLKPTEGLGEGTKGHKFMETHEQDSLDNVEQD